jgi:hypothetical protein
MVLSPSVNFLSSASIFVKLTGEFTSLEEPSNDYAVVSVLDLLANGPDFIGSEKRIEPNYLMRKFRLPNAISIS